MKVDNTDNRDQGTTWLWIKDDTDYVEVDPSDIYGNMIENCYNEDVLFLFERFMNYLDKLPDEGIKDDTKTDHIKGFHVYLGNLIASNRR